MITAPFQAWNQFWFAPISAKPLGAYRIVYGLIAIFSLSMLFVDIDYWLTDRGMIQGDEARLFAGPFRHSPLQWFQDPVSARVAVTLTLGAAFGVTLGWHTKVMSILLYLGMLSIHHRNIQSASGADVLLMVNTFYVMLSPCGAAYSLDARRARKQRGDTAADPLIVPWAQRLIQLQICVLYFVTALWKSTGSTWLDGTAVHYVLCNREVGRFDMSALAAYPVLVNFLTYSGLLIEFALAFLIWFKPCRPWVIFSGLGLHFGILFLVNIPIFGELSTAMYIVFISSSEWESLAQRCNPMSAIQGLSDGIRSRFRWPERRAIGSIASAETVNMPT
jgi:hypothetical protein